MSRGKIGEKFRGFVRKSFVKEIRKMMPYRWGLILFPLEKIFRPSILHAEKVETGRRD